MNDELSSLKSAMLGHAVADAMGVPVEFESRETLKKDPVTGYRGYGSHSVPAGTWSDDTSMNLASLDSLSRGLDYGDMLERFCRWKNQAAYTVTKERRIRKNGDWYVVSPFALMWGDENYYMLAWDAEAASLKHYRVDKMLDITALKQEREGKEAFAQVDMSAYSKKIFSMFTGEDRSVKLRFRNNLAGAVFDRFGRDVMLIPDGEDHFVVTLELAVSPHFYSCVWPVQFRQRHTRQQNGRHRGNDGKELSRRI